MRALDGYLKKTQKGVKNVNNKFRIYRQKICKKYATGNQKINNIIQQKN